MRLRYYFCNRFNTELAEFLQKENVKYKITGASTRLPLIVFNIWSDEIGFENKLRIVRELGAREPLQFAEYSKAEYSNAKLLVMRPKKQLIGITNEAEAFRFSCKWINSIGETVVRHEKQVKALAIDKEPAINAATAFWSEDTGFSVIFTSQYFVDLAIENQLTGLLFHNVMLENGEYSKNLFQMTSDKIVSRDCIGTGYGEIVEVCPHCGAEQYFIDEAHQLHLDFSKIQMQSDLYMTEQIFGQGDPYSLFLISQRFYQLLKKTKMDSNVAFSPVIDIS